MTNEYQIRVVPEVAAQEDRLKAYLAEEQGFDVRTIFGVRILKRSIDARQRQIYVMVVPMQTCMVIISY